MKTDFSINVKVSIGLTAEVAELVKAFLNPKPTTEQPTDTHDQAETTTETTTPSAEAPQAPATEESKPVEQTPQTAAPKKLTAEDVRAAMQMTRSRIEGEDYENNTDSEGYRKYHKPLSGKFKEIAASLDPSSKPTTLPAELIPSSL